MLIQYGADMNLNDEAYQSAPLGLAARCGHHDLVEYFLKQDADSNTAGALWVTPLAWAQKKDMQKLKKR